MWDQARIYRDRRLQRGTAWRLLMADEEYSRILSSLNINAAGLFNKLKKEVYARGAADEVLNDAQRFVQAGKHMELMGNGFFR